MKSIFILENFDQYVRDVYHPINEAEGTGLSPEESKMVISSMIDSQSKMALRISKITDAIKKIFGEEILQGMKKYPGKWAGSKEGIVASLAKADDKTAGDIKKKRDDFFKKIVEFDSQLNEMNLGKSKEENKNYRPAVIMALFSQFMSEESKLELGKALTKRSSELNLSYKKISKQIEDKAGDSSTMGKAPAILGYVDIKEIEKVTETPGKEPVAFSLLDEAKQKTLFIDNSWDLNPQVAKELRDQIYGVLERRKMGGYSKITEFNIQSSASRYRNKGKAESLSWGQLSFKRSQVVYNMVREILTELQIPEGDPIREELTKVAKIDINGSNGDGTSGPNPLPDPTLGKLRVGYYETVKKQNRETEGSSKFIDKDISAPQQVYITKIDGFGNSEGAPTVKEMDILKKKEDYDPFKYVNVSVKVVESGIKPGEAPSVTITKVPLNSIAPKIILERKGEKGENGGDWDFKFKLPKFRIIPVGFGDLNPIQDLCGGF